MMWRRSLSRPGLAGLPAASHASRDCPPFHARVVKPRISTLTPQRSSVRARMSAQVAATVMGRPLVELRRKGVILRPARLVAAMAVRPRRLARRLVIAEFAVVERVGCRGLRAL